MLKALIFDFDGLMIDTESPEYVALCEIYAEYGHTLPITTYVLIVGSEYNEQFEPISYLRGLTGEAVDVEAFWQRMNSRRMDIIEKLPPLPGVEDLIRDAKTRGIKLAVASSSPHSWVDKHLKRLNLFHYFDVIKCKDDVARVKPMPDLFLAALKELHMQKNEVVIFEDSLNGIIAAQRAGIRVIAVPNQITTHSKIQGEIMRLQSLADITLDELLNKL